MLRVLRFWLDRGVDGFRIDVAHALYKHPTLADLPQGVQNSVDNAHVWDRDEVLAVYEEWRRLVDSYDGDRMMVGEVFLFDVPRIARYVSGSRLHQAFNFTVMATPWGAAPLRKTLELALEHFSPGTWVLSNHDLTRHVTRYGGGALGRRRGMAVTALLFALPGSPYLYQGEELGLDEVDVPPDLRQDPIFSRTDGALPGRDGCRTPIPWSASEPGFGFTTGDPWLPFGPDSAARAADVQRADPESTLSSYRRLLASRKALVGAELGDEVTFLDTEADVLAFRRGDLVAVLNTATEPVQVKVPGELVEATADGASTERGVVTVPAASTVWLRSSGG